MHRCEDAILLVPEEGAPAKEGRWPLKSGGGKEMDFLWSPDDTFMLG